MAHKSICLTRNAPFCNRKRFIICALCIAVNIACSIELRNCSHIFIIQNKINNLRLLKQIDTYAIANNCKNKRLWRTVSTSKMRVSSLPTAFTRWGDKASPCSCHDRASISGASAQSPARYQLRAIVPLNHYHENILLKPNYCPETELLRRSFVGTESLQLILAILLLILMYFCVSRPHTVRAERQRP